MIFDPGMVPLDPERDFHQNGGNFMPVASIWACFEQKRILRNLVCVSWSVHQITYFLEIGDLAYKIWYPNRSTVSGIPGRGLFFLRKARHWVDGFRHSWQGPFVFSEKVRPLKKHVFLFSGPNCKTKVLKYAQAVQG